MRFRVLMFHAVLQILRSFRVPAVYLTSAFLWFFSILLFRRINNLRRINPPEGFESHPGCLQFLEVHSGDPAWSLDAPHSAFGITSVADHPGVHAGLSTLARLSVLIRQ